MSYAKICRFILHVVQNGVVLKQVPVSSLCRAFVQKDQCQLYLHLGIR